MHTLQTGPPTGVDEREAWNAETDTAVSALSTAADGRIYIGDEDGTVYALSAAFGTERWRFEAEARVRSIAGESGTVYVGTYDRQTGAGEDKGDVYALTTDQ